MVSRGEDWVAFGALEEPAGPRYVLELSPTAPLASREHTFHWCGAAGEAPQSVDFRIPEMPPFGAEDSALTAVRGHPLEVTWTPTPSDYTLLVAWLPGGDTVRCRLRNGAFELPADSLGELLENVPSATITPVQGTFLRREVRAESVVRVHVRSQFRQTVAFGREPLQ